MHITTLIANVKTTAMGVALLFLAAGKFIKFLLDDDPSTIADFDLVIQALIGLGLVAAKDDDKSSKSLGLE